MSKNILFTLEPFRLWAWQQLSKSAVSLAKVCVPMAVEVCGACGQHILLHFATRLATKSSLPMS